MPFWHMPLILLVFFGAPLLVGYGLQMLLAQWFEVFRTHPGAARITLAVVAMPFLWLLFVRSDREAQRLAVLTWSHLVVQWLGLAMALPLAALVGSAVHPNPPEWLVCVLFLLLLPISVYLAGAIWLFVARYIASADELRRVTEVHTRFDDKIVGKAKGRQE